MSSIILGIDISKKTFDAALLINNKTKARKFDNTMSGFVSFKEWLAHQKIYKAHVCMESTGCYGEKLAYFLYNNNFNVSM